MTEQQIKKAVEELISLAINGKWETAFEKFYHPDVQKTDLDGVIVNGWATNFENGKVFSSKISNIREFSCVGNVVKGNRSFIIWSFDFDVDGSPLKIVEVAIQDWKDEKIISERFFA